MVRFFTYCWQHSEVLRYPDGERVVVAYGSQFARRGICPMDEVYFVSIRGGRIHLLSKMVVRVVTHSAEHCRRYAGVAPEPAAEYLIAGSYTPARLVLLPGELARSLRFIRGKEWVALNFRDETLVDRQSLRSVRRVSAPSAFCGDISDRRGYEAKEKSLKRGRPETKMS
jgi:hypothetical protein